MTRYERRSRNAELLFIKYGDFKSGSMTPEDYYAAVDLVYWELRRKNRRTVRMVHRNPTGRVHTELCGQVRLGFKVPYRKRKHLRTLF